MMRLSSMCIIYILTSSESIILRCWRLRALAFFFLKRPFFLKRAQQQRQHTDTAADNSSSVIN